MSKGRKAAIAGENQLKLCRRCGRELPLDSFNKGTGMFGKQSRCRDCEHEIHNEEGAKKRRQEARDLKRKTVDGYTDSEWDRHIRTLLSNETSYKKYLVRGAKERAKAKNIPFNITHEDINIPEYCPLLGIKLNKHIGQGKRNTNDCWDSPSIDRIIPELGYVKGNVWVVSLKANTIKNNSTLKELESLVINLRNKIESEK